MTSLPRITFVFVLMMFEESVVVHLPVDNVTSTPFFELQFPLFLFFDNVA